MPCDLEQRVVRRMRILLGTQWLRDIGGSETFTYALAAELRRRGHEVDVFTFFPGAILDRIVNDLGAQTLAARRYDVVFANHGPICDALAFLAPTVQTCHGVFPPVEQPNAVADAFVAVSEEVAAHLQTLGHRTTVIMNGVDCERFSRVRWPSERLRSVACLAQGEAARREVWRACGEVGVRCVMPERRVWHVEHLINDVDMVIGIGRTAYDAFACGRPVVLFDSRPYAAPLADGYFLDVMPEALHANCSGRTFRIPATAAFLRQQFTRYDYGHSASARAIAVASFDVRNAVDQYLRVADAARAVRRQRMRMASWRRTYATSALRLLRFVVAPRVRTVRAALARVVAVNRHGDRS